MPHERDFNASRRVSETGYAAPVASCSMVRIRLSAYFRDPQSWSRSLDHAASEIERATDPMKAQSLVRQGRKAEQAGNRSELERVVRELWQLYPVDQEERGLSFNSGVR